MLYPQKMSNLPLMRRLGKISFTMQFWFTPEASPGLPDCQRPWALLANSVFLTKSSEAFKRCLNFILARKLNENCYMLVMRVREVGDRITRKVELVSKCVENANLEVFKM